MKMDLQELELKKELNIKATQALHPVKAKLIATLQNFQDRMPEFTELKELVEGDLQLESDPDSGSLWVMRTIFKISQAANKLAQKNGPNDWNTNLHPAFKTLLRRFKADTFRVLGISTDAEWPEEFYLKDSDFK